MKISIILLAAGTSSRLGQPKQLLPVRGVSMVEYAMSMWSAMECDQRICVTGHMHDQMDALARRQGWTPRYNADYLLGLGSSIKSAIHTMDLTRSNGVIICVCDQPLIPLSYYQRFWQMVMSHPHSLVVSKYIQDFGVPTYFPRSYFAELSRISNHSGAKTLIHSGLSDAKFLYCAQGHRDIDTPYDLQYLSDLEVLNS